MFAPLDVPGYDVLAPLGGAGRTGKAIAMSERVPVVLRRVYGGEEVLRRLRREAALWGSVSGGHVVAVRDVVAVEPDVTVVVSDYAPGGGLDTLLSRRGSLDDGEVVTLVVPLAQTLAEAHRRGLAHGRVSTGNIVFTEDGRPMLADAALTTLDADSAAGDVAALIAVAQEALGGGRRSGPVQAALTAPVETAADLAAAVRAAAAARPISLHATRIETTQLPNKPASTRQRRPLVVAVAIFAAALAGGVAWGHRDDASAGRMPVAPPTATTTVDPEPTASTAATASAREWWRVVQRLELGRVRGYKAAVRRDGLRPVGLRIRLESVQLVRVDGDRAVVHVVDGWASYTLVDERGHVVAQRNARHRDVRLLLRRTSAGWQLERVV